MHVAGIDPRESWDYTWGEGIEAVDAYNRRENARARRRAVALYNASIFLAQTVIGGQIRKFDEAFPGFDGTSGQKPEPMSDDAMYAHVRALNAMFGGEEVD